MSGTEDTEVNGRRNEGRPEQEQPESDPTQGDAWQRWEAAKEVELAPNAWVRDLADRLGLCAWRVNLRLDKDDGDVAASAYCVYGRKILWITLRPSFMDCSREERRYIVCHELVHAHFEAAWQHVEDLGVDLGMIAHRRLQLAFKQDMEYGIDGVSSIIAEHMPLPPK
jgi:hypothetical protein